MQITIFGANGRVGSLVVQKALANDYKVVAFIHGKSKFVAHKNLQLANGDIYSYSDVEKAIKGSDAVISALGSWGTPNKDILTRGMENIIPAMYKHGVRRIISLTGADASLPSEKLSLFMSVNKLILKLFANKILHDGEEHLKLLLNSDLDWTVLRSPVMNDKGDESHHVLSIKKPMPWSTVNRASVASAMLSQLKISEFIRQAPYINRSK